jgi:hypothetical protein
MPKSAQTVVGMSSGQKNSRLWQLLIAVLMGGGLSLASVFVVLEALCDWIVRAFGYGYTLGIRNIGFPTEAAGPSDTHRMIGYSVAFGCCQGRFPCRA